MTNEQREEIRQKARELYAGKYWYKGKAAVFTMEDMITLAAFVAESLLSGGAAEHSLADKIAGILLACGIAKMGDREALEEIKKAVREFTILKMNSAGAAPPAASPQPEFELEGSLGKVTIQPGQRFMDGNVLWEIVRKTGHGTYSPFGLGGMASVACKVVSGTPDGRFKNFAPDGTLEWCGDSLASAVIAYRRTVSAASGQEDDQYCECSHKNTAHTRLNGGCEGRHPDYRPCECKKFRQRAASGGQP